MHRGSTRAFAQIVERCHQPDLRIIGAAENLPELPSASIVLLRKANSASSPIIEFFAEYIDPILEKHNADLGLHASINV